MATGTTLFNLIQTLSSSEKKAFTQYNDLKKNTKIYTEVINIIDEFDEKSKDKIKLYLKERTSQKEKNYGELFSLLTKIDSYNKTQILEYFGKDFTSKDLHAAESYLYKKLILSLKKSYSKKSIDIQINDLILEATILHQRGLYELAINIFTKAEDLALKHDKRGILLDIAHIKAESVFAHKKKGVIPTINDIYQTAHAVIPILKEELYYRHENVKLVAAHRTLIRDKTNLNQILADCQKIKKKGFPATGSFYSRYYYHSILAIAAYMRKDYVEAGEHQAKVLYIWDQSSDITKANLQTYITQLANNINYLICAKKYKEAFLLIMKMEQLSPSHVDERGELFQNVYLYKQIIYLNQQDYISSKELIPSIKKGLKKYDKKINRSRKLALSYNIALTYWLLNNYDEAIDSLNKLSQNAKYDETRPDIMKAVHLLKLSIFYVKDVNEIGNKIRSVERQVKKLSKAPLKTRTTKNFEQTLLFYFKQLANCPPYKSEKKRILKEFKIALKTLDPIYQKELGYEEYSLWVEKYDRTFI